MTVQQAITIVNSMELEEGHTLDVREALAIHVLLKAGTVLDSFAMGMSELFADD